MRPDVAMGPVTGIAIAEAPAAPPAQWRRSALVDVVGLLALPLVLYVLLEVSPFFIQNGVDPFIYVGYTENQPDLVTRFGFTYFAVRFGLILPGRLLSSTFGPVAGYFVLRYLLAVLCAGAVYLLARRCGSRAAGWFGAVLCLSSPILLRALMTTYSDTTGLPFLLAGTACLLMPSPHRLRWAAGSGVFIGLAVNSNMYVAAVAAVAFAAWLAIQLLRRDWSAAARLALAAALAIAVTVAGALYYRVAFGDGDIIGPSIDALRAYSGETARFFRAPTRDWLGFSLHLYLPLLVAAATAAVLVTRMPSPGEKRAKAILGARPLLDVLVMLLAVEGLYLYQQFVADGYSLETYYYTSYQFALVVLGATLAVVELTKRRWFGERGAWVLAGLALAIPLARNLVFDSLELWAWPAVPVMVGATGLALVLSRWRTVAGWVGAVALVTSFVLLGLAPPRNVPYSPGQTVRFDPSYDQAVGHRTDEGLELYDLATQVIRVVPRWSSDPGSVVFWYRNEPSTLNNLQSTYLWRATTLQGGGPGLPALEPDQVKLLQERTPRRIVVLGLDPADLALGEARLAEVGLQPLDVQEHTLTSGGTTVHVAVLTFEPSACDQDWRTWTMWRSLPPCG